MNQNSNIVQFQPSFLQDAFSQIREMVQSQMRGSALTLMMELFNEEVESLCGKVYSRKKPGIYYRGGSDPGSVVLAGQRVAVKKPRVKSSDGEVGLSVYNALQGYDLLCDRVMSHMLTGVSTRNYDALLDDVSGGLGVSKSTVSKVFVKASQEKLDLINSRDLGLYRWVAVMIDAIEFSGRSILVAMGITVQGKKLILGLKDGSSESSGVCVDLIQNLIDRNFHTKAPFLFFLD